MPPPAPRITVEIPVVQAPPMARIPRLRTSREIPIAKPMPIVPDDSVTVVAPVSAPAEATAPPVFAPIAEPFAEPIAEPEPVPDVPVLPEPEPIAPPLPSPAPEPVVPWDEPAAAPPASTLRTVLVSVVVVCVFSALGLAVGWLFSSGRVRW